MKKVVTNFTESDRALLNSHIGVAKTIAQFLGDHSEVILHTLESLDQSVMYIINGHHTGRKAGAPMTDYGMKMLKNYLNTGEVNPKSYFTHDKNGRMIKSITSIITNEESNAIGMLCVNFNVSAPFPEIVKVFFPDSVDSLEDENFVASTHEAILSQLDKVKMEVENNNLITIKNRNKTIISQIYEQGLFEFKDSVNIVSENLGITRHAVYKRIRELKNT